MTVNDFFTNLASGATWAAGVAFQRSNPLPLDKYSVFQSEADLVTYVTTNAVAYPGQIVAVYDATSEEMHAFVISSVGENGTYIPVGTETVVDGKSIKAKEDGSLELAGFADADGLTLPQKQADGSIAWVTIDAIVKSDGNTKYSLVLEGNSLQLKSDDGSDDSEAIDLSKYLDNTDTTYTLSQNGMAITLTPSEGEAQTVTVDAYSKSEIDAKFEALPEDEDTTYSAKANDKVLKLVGTEFSTELSLQYADNRISLTGVNGEEIAGFDASVFVEDGVLQDVNYNEETRELTFTWNIITGTDEEGNVTYKTDVVSIADLVDTYAAGNGLSLEGNSFSVKIAEDSESFLSVDANGLKLSGIQNAIDAAAAAHEGLENRIKALEDVDNTTQAELDAYKEQVTSAIATAKGEAIADAESKYATKEYVGVIPNDAEGNPQAANVIAYVNKKAQEVLDSATGGSSESAASVKQQLDTYKTENDPKVKALLEEVWGSETYTGDSRIDALEAVGAQANVLESVVVDNGAVEGVPAAKLTATFDTNAKKVTLNDASLQNAIAAAQTKANEAATAASGAQATADANAANIQTNASDISNLKTTVGEHTSKISALEAHDTAHTAEFNALNSTVQNQGTEIAGLKSSKAETTALNEAVARIAANEASIKTLNETTIPGINATLADKANTSSVYTKDEVNAITGTPAEGKTLVQMIADAKSEASYDDTQVKADIKANADAIAALTNGAVKNNADAIAALTEQVGNVSNIMNFVGAKDEIPSNNAGYESGDVIIVGNQEYVFDGTEWQPFGDASINGALISTLDTRVSANETAIAAINNGETGILAQAKAYTNSQIAALPIASSTLLGLVKFDDSTIKMNDSNQLYISQVSTDTLVQGTLELVLSSGNAKGYENIN